MSKTPSYWNKAKKYLSKKDKVMSSLIKKYKSPSETVLTSRRDVFFSLCKSIIGQQISVAAANSVFLKFKKKCKNKINAKTVSKLSTIQLKSCGLSRQKVKGIKSLAQKILSKEFNPRLISKMSDEDAIIFGYFIWDEVPTFKTLLGAGLVILSSFIIFRRELILKKRLSVSRHE